MKNLLIGLLLCVPFITISGCTMNTVGYDEDILSDNVYSINYESSPFWGNTYYTGYGWNGLETEFKSGNDDISIDPNR